MEVIAPMFLHVIEGLVRHLEEGRVVHPVDGSHGDTDARGYARWNAVNGKVAGSLEHSLCLPLDGFPGQGACHHDHELVAAKPSHAVILAADELQLERELYENLVSILVAMGIIDVLEMVEIHGVEYGLPAVLQLPAYLRADVFRRSLVAKAGQAVGLGFLAVGILGGAERVDIAKSP